MPRAETSPSCRTAIGRDRGSGRGERPATCSASSPTTRHDHYDDGLADSPFTGMSNRRGTIRRGRLASGERRRRWREGLSGRHAGGGCGSAPARVRSAASGPRGGPGRCAGRSPYGAHRTPPATSIARDLVRESASPCGALPHRSRERPKPREECESETLSGGRCVLESTRVVVNRRSGRSSVRRAAYEIVQGRREPLAGCGYPAKRAAHARPA